MMERSDHPEARHRWILPGLGAIGLVTFGIGLLQSPPVAWSYLLLGNYYFVALALYGTVFVALTHIFSAGWAVVFRRVPEAMSAYLPFGAVIMLALYFGRSELYPWARPEAVAADPHLQHKAIYLNTPFFFLRMAIAFGLWILFSHLIRRHSQQQDIDGDLAHTRKNRIYSAWFLIAFAATIIFSSFDWIMSLEPKWYSTIFPIYTAVGLFLGGTAALIVLTIYFRERGLLPGVTHHHLYEMARVLCATSTVWAYIWFSQYMLIYYTNIPEEAVYYALRIKGMGRTLFQLNLVLNWLLPMLMLVPVRTRYSSAWLLRVCAVVLAGRWLDLHLLITPAVGGPAQFDVMEILIFLGFLPLFILPLISVFRRAEPVPRRDPYLVESASLSV